MSLLESQMAFSQLIARFILDLKSKDYDVTLGEAYRSQQEAEINAETGQGIANSLHCQRLAIDLNLFKDGVYLTSFSDTLPAGELWESYKSPSCLVAWGGRFAKLDTDHFSLSYNGIK